MGVHLYVCMCSGTQIDIPNKITDYRKLFHPYCPNIILANSKK